MAVTINMEGVLNLLWSKDFNMAQFLLLNILKIISFTQSFQDLKAQVLCQTTTDG